MSLAPEESAKTPDASSRLGILRGFLLLVGIWMIPALLSTSLVVYAEATKGTMKVIEADGLVREFHGEFSAETVWKAVGSQVPPWLFWIPVTPLLFVLARRFPLERGRRLRNGSIHLVAMTANSVVNLAFSTAACAWSQGGACSEMPFWKAFQRLVIYYTEMNVVIYGVVVAVASAIEYQRRAREGELRAVRLETLAAQAQLAALKMQLHPHFLFNTLNAISVLIRKGDADTALRMVLGVSDLLRIALDQAGKQLVPLHEELDFLERYLDVERTRFQDRLTVRRNVAPGVLDALVPNLLLQPVVENAIRHGIEPRSEPGTVEISAREEGARLCITVRDDGAGLGRDGVKGTGIGLANVRQRLEQQYPGNHRFAIEDAPGRGVLVTLEIPLQRDRQAAA